MVTPELITFIESALKDDSETEVKARLKAGGWNEKDVADAFNQINSSKQNNKSASSNRIILIIDDNKFYREFYRSELSQHNFTVELASDGEEGEKKAAELKPSAIILDIILPKKDGFEVLRDIKGNTAIKDIPVIISSSLENNADIRRLKDMGAVNIFNKAGTLPKDIASYIDDLVSKGITQAKASPDTTVHQPDTTTVNLASEEVKSTFQTIVSQIEQELSELLNSKVTESGADITALSTTDLETKISEIASVPGTIFICSEVQAKKPSLAILSIKRDDALSIIKFSEKGALGQYLDPNENDKLLKNIFGVMSVALVNKFSATLSGTFWSKPPLVVSSKDLVDTFTKLNIPKTDTEVLMRAIYGVASINTYLSFYAFISQDILVKDKK